MSRKLHISDALWLPTDVVTSTQVVYGGKGMGKTNYGGALVEECAAAGLRFAVLDPMGVWWGLRHSSDGKGPGIEVLILGGRHGDIPIEPTGGAVVADLVVDEAVNVVIDISRKPDGTMWSIGERVRFVADYTKRLYQRQGEKRRPLLQVIDEAARFCPQVIRKGDEQVAACMGAVAVLVEEGRNVGLGVCLITQRSARLNKDVAELADAMIAFRTVGPNSRRAVLDWLGEHVEKEKIKTLDEQVRSLPRGSALVVSPGWLEYEGVVPMRARQTFDSSATPKPGQERRASGPGAKPDLGKYQERMKATIERAKADDPRELRKRIAELERAKAQAAPRAPAAAPVVKTKVERVEVPVVGEGTIKRIERTVEKLVGVSGDLATGIQMLREAFERVARAPLRPPALPYRPVHKGPAVPVVREQGAPSNGDAPKLRSGARRMLEQLAIWHPRPLMRSELSVLAGVQMGGGTFGDYLSNLKAAGYIESAQRDITITPEGLAAAGEVRRPHSCPEIVALYSSKLRAGARRMLDILVARYPDGITRAELSQQSGVSQSGGTFGDYLSNLRACGLLDENGRELRAAQVLFMVPT